LRSLSPFLWVPAQLLPCLRRMLVTHPVQPRRPCSSSHRMASSSRKLSHGHVVVFWEAAHLEWCMRRSVSNFQCYNNTSYTYIPNCKSFLVFLIHSVMHLDICYMFRYIVKTINLKKIKRPIIWNGGSIIVSLCCLHY
jgi:hypothetical protein